ncbi:hypothetical protein BU17DRAFT_87462 [Hysterangium stoloniferum]|nr:hypothetical protein BU17DRAFT_87462 [Hysterangium stoloniferum]
MSDLRERYHNAGPSALLCLTFNSAAIQQFYNSREQRMENATTESLQKLMFGSPLLTDEFTHQICVIRRSDYNSVYFYTVGPATDVVRRQLLIKIWTFEQNGVLKMLRRLIHGSIRGIRSFSFEAYFQKAFAEGINIDAKPMSRGHPKNSRWHSTFDNSSSIQEGPRNASLDTSSDFSLHVTPAYH